MSWPPPDTIGPRSGHGGGDTSSVIDHRRGAGADAQRGAVRARRRENRLPDLGCFRSASPPWTRSHGQGRLLYRRDPDTVRGADVVFISTERYERRTRTLTFLDVAPKLVVEVLSVRDAVMDLADKLREYFAAGVKLGWVVDPRKRSVYAYRYSRRSAGTYGDQHLSGEEVLHGFTARAAALFEE
jgi:hypothetical protein